MIELHETQQKWPLNQYALHLGSTKVEMTKNLQQNPIVCNHTQLASTWTWATSVPGLYNWHLKPWECSSMLTLFSTLNWVVRCMKLYYLCLNTDQDKLKNFSSFCTAMRKGPKSSYKVHSSVRVNALLTSLIRVMLFLDHNMKDRRMLMIQSKWADRVRVRTLRSGV